MWFISAANPARPGEVTARAHTMDRCSGVWLPRMLVAGTLEELCAKLPSGLTRRARAPLDAPGAVEMWD